MPDKNPSPSLIHEHDRLAWIDHLAYKLFCATGRNQLMQCIWIYRREVDQVFLESMIERLAALPFNRLIEPSPLPGGRPRWVKPTVRNVPLEKYPGLLRRSRLLEWANQHARKLIDPVKGPAWRVAIQRFDDGTTAVSFVGSHLVLDGMGALCAIDAAANNTELPSPYLPKGARGWLSASWSDARQMLTDAPSILAALYKIIQTSWNKSAVSMQKSDIRATDTHRDMSEHVEIPAIAVTVELHAWNACARRLGGHTSAMLPAFVALLASHLGRCRPSDGTVSLLVPIGKRHGLADERALAIEFRTMTVDPTNLATNLRPIKEPLKAMLRDANNKTDALALLLPAIAWLPRSITTALVNQLFQYNNELPVSCSYLGTLPTGFACIDGAPCERVLTRAVDVNVTHRDLQRSHGHLVVVASCHAETISLCIEAYQLAPTPTTTEMLRQATQQTLAEFELDAVIES